MNQKGYNKSESEDKDGRDSFRLVCRRLKSPFDCQGRSKGFNDPASSIEWVRCLKAMYWGAPLVAIGILELMSGLPFRAVVAVFYAAVVVWLLLRVWKLEDGIERNQKE